MDPIPRRESKRSDTRHHANALAGKAKKPFRHFLSLFLGLLWLAPMITLLVLNANSKIIGASVWCPFGHCVSDSYSSYDSRKAQKFDGQDHYTLGALQVVAKLLEIWFMCIAGSLVYSVAKLLSQGQEGLPLGYLFSHVKFSDPLSFVHRQPWKTAMGAGSSPQRKAKLILFLAFTFALCILLNLMGPASAVLCLPTLRWIKLKEQGILFGHLALGDQPTSTVFLHGPNCTDENLRLRQYSCASELYGPQLDVIASTVTSTYQGANLHPWFYEATNFVTTDETGLGFTFNLSGSEDQPMSYTPLRQTIRSMAYDYTKFLRANEGEATEPPPILNWNRSLDAVISMDGPVIGVVPAWNFTTPEVVAVGGNNSKQIRCFHSWFRANYTTCARVGRAWNPANKVASFHINAPETFRRFNYTNSTSMEVYIYWSDSVARFNDVNNTRPDCMLKRVNNDCDWEKDFRPGLLENDTSSELIIEFDPNLNAGRMLFEFLFFTSFATYEISARDDHQLVSTSPHAIDEENADLFNTYGWPQSHQVDPDWILAAWGVDLNGTLNTTRPAVSILTSTLLSWWKSDLSIYNYRSNNSMDDAISVFGDIVILSVYQAMSLVSFTNQTTLTDDVDAIQGATDTQPILRKYGKVYAWAFGLTSRTSILGTVVVSIGIVCTLLRTALCIYTGSHQFSEVDYMSAALQYDGEETGEKPSTVEATSSYQVVSVNDKPSFRRRGQYNQLEEWEHRDG